MPLRDSRSDVVGVEFQDHSDRRFRCFSFNSGAGKTSLIKKYIQGKFQDEYEVTVGVDFYSKTVQIDEEHVQLQIWDTVLTK